jgi:hypothetical protein
MVVNDLDIRWTECPSGPLKADSPLVIDANAVPSLSVTLQGFESVSRECSEVPELDSRFHAIQLQSGRAFDPSKGIDPLTGCEVSGPLVPVADDHVLEITGNYGLRQA